MLTATASKKKPAESVASPLAALVALAVPKKGEQFAGIVRENDAWHIVVLLPGELESGTWKDSTAWAKKQGGELPTRQEQSLLFANLKDEFKPRSYWSAEQYASDARSAWYQYFDYGGQDCNGKYYELRARAVRRLPI